MGCLLSNHGCIVGTLDDNYDTFELYVDSIIIFIFRKKQVLTVTPNRKRKKERKKEKEGQKERKKEERKKERKRERKKEKRKKERKNKYT